MLDGHGVSVACRVVVYRVSHRIGEVCSDARSRRDGCILAVGDGWSQVLDVQRGRNIDHDGLGVLIDGTYVGVIDLERGNLRLVSLNLDGPVEIYITIGDMYSLWGRHVELVVYIDVTLCTIAEAQLGDTHLRDVVGLWHSHGYRASSLVDGTIVIVESQFRNGAASAQIQI